MFLEIDGHIQHVMRRGNPTGPAVVLLHALGTCAAVWERQVGLLEQHYDVICPEFRGHGLSEVSRDPLTVERLADDVMGALSALGIERFHLCGISLGGMVAQIVAGRFPNRVQTLTIFDSSIQTLSPGLWRDRAAKVRNSGLAAISSNVLARWMTPAALKTIEGRGLAAMLAGTPSEGYAAGCDALAIADCRASAASLAMPVSVAVGSLDEAMPLGASQVLAGAIRQATLREIAGAAHIPLFEQGEAVNEILLASLGQS